MIRSITLSLACAISLSLVGMTGCASEPGEVDKQDQSDSKEPTESSTVHTDTIGLCDPVVFPICGGGQTVHCTIDPWRCRHCSCGI